MDIFSSLKDKIFAIIAVVLILIAIYSVIRSQILNNRKLKTGEDKQIFLRFAKSIFEQPELYEYVVGYNIESKQHLNSTTYYYFSYVVAFNEEELYICPFKCVNHVPVLRQKMKIDFQEATVKYRLIGKKTKIIVNLAGNKMHVFIEDKVMSDGDSAAKPFTVYQVEERSRLNQCLLRFAETASAFE